jgi:NADH:ubiquinone oxidoreductase subunit 2 (subunit N)
MNIVISPALTSVIILAVGALLILLFTSALTRNSAVLATIGAVTLLLAVLPSLRADGATLAVTLVVAAAGIVAMLLLQGVEIEEPSQKPEIVALLLLGSAGGIVFATATDRWRRRASTSSWPRSRWPCCCSGSGWSSWRLARSTGRR